MPDYSSLSEELMYQKANIILQNKKPQTTPISAAE
jgi:hypothetical protein